MRRAMEGILYAYGVDIIISGHVHSYERSLPVFNNTLNECGPVYLNLGDGGNYEGPAGLWKDYTELDPDAAADGTPSWSAFRENSFGVGSLEFQDATSAVYAWHRHACASNKPNSYGMNFSSACESPTDNSPQKMLTSDAVTLVRPSKEQCPNRWVSTSNEPPSPIPEPSSPTDESKSLFSTLEIGLVVGLAVLTLGCVVMTVLLFRSRASPPALDVDPASKEYQ